VLTSGHDANGNRTRLDYPDGSFFVYGYDGLNRLNCVAESPSNGICDPQSGSARLVTVEYRSDGRRSGLLRPGASTTNYSFNNANRLDVFGQDFAGTADDLTNNFTYNPAGQITQLTFVNSLYAYVGNMNRTGGYSVDGLNRYSAINGFPQSYDGNGNLTSEGGNGLTYDMENRLVATSGTTGTLKYDPLGRLTETSIVPSATTQFLYDGDALVAEYSINGNTATQTRRYVHGDHVDEPWVQYEISGGTTSRRYLHADHQGSIVAFSDATGAATKKLAYDAFGIPKGTNQERFGYTGQTFLKELGLYYYKARFYSPKLGRFLQTDPVFYADDMNMYAYVRNDPVSFNDPTGAVVKLVNAASPEKRSTYAAMISYLKNSPAFATRFSALERSSHTYQVNLSSLVRRDEYLPETRTININPRSALSIDGSIQSPALGFGHEVDHAYRHDKDAAQFLRDGERKALGSQIQVGADGVMEQVVTYQEAPDEVKAVAAENEMASELGEPGRKTHSDGKSVEVNDVRHSCIPGAGHQCPLPR
jgi:RHS repeat-associated protein